MTPNRDGVLSTCPPSLSAKHLVIGSGPGGSVAACVLAEAGLDVLLCEEGPYLSLDSCAPFSQTEMTQKYRNGGLTVAIAPTRLMYVEARCVGGGSEINSGLYHRTPSDVLEEWAATHKVARLGYDDLVPHFEAVENELSVSLQAGLPPPPAAALRAGADRLGWKSVDVPRWYTAPSSDPPAAGGRHSMTETFVPRALSAGRRWRRTRGHCEFDADRTAGKWNCVISRPAGDRSVSPRSPKGYLSPAAPSILPHSCAEAASRGSPVKCCGCIRR